MWSDHQEELESAQVGLGRSDHQKGAEFSQVDLGPESDWQVILIILGVEE